jgi:hypothetical protein
MDVILNGIWSALEWVENTSISDGIREGFLFDRLANYYLLLMFHSFGMAVIVGVSFFITARLFGMGRSFPLSDLTKLLPLGWVGFFVNLVSGTLLFIGQPRRSLLTVMYDFKMLFVLSACLLILALGKSLSEVQVVAASDGMMTEFVSDRARVIALSATLVWLMAVAAGRIIGYTEPPPR